MSIDSLRVMHHVELSHRPSNRVEHSIEPRCGCRWRLRSMLKIQDEIRPAGWHKGASGNKAGKPRGTRHKATLAAEALLCDHDGQQLAYVYFEDEPGRRSAAKLLSKDEARRIAAKIARRRCRFGKEKGRQFGDLKVGLRGTTERNSEKHVASSGTFSIKHRSVTAPVLLFWGAIYGTVAAFGSMWRPLTRVEGP
jgi:hypothetical protein